MKRKIRFSPQEAISAVVESIVTAHMLASGIPMDQATLIGASLGGAMKGFSLSDCSTADTILSSLEKSITSVLEGDSFELTDTCRELLQSEILSPSKIIDFMCQPDSNRALRNQILQICERDPNSDISTFPVDEVVSKIEGQFKLEVLNNHELAAYASYCMLRSLTSSAGIHLANQQYVDSFKEPLFLHKDSKDSRVNMENLFVLQRYKSLRCDSDEQQEDSENNQKNLQDMLADFLLEKNEEFLFIEGDAGSGKTTLVAWMNYHYSLGDETAAQLFGNRPLLTIRLRDLDKKYISENRDLSTAIRKYMNLSSLDELEQLFPNAIMVLDGFDELCMIEGIGFQHEAPLYIRRKLAAVLVELVLVTHHRNIRLHQRVYIVRAVSVFLKQANAERGRVDFAFLPLKVVCKLPEYLSADFLVDSGRQNHHDCFPVNQLYTVIFFLCKNVRERVPLRFCW